MQYITLEDAKKRLEGIFGEVRIVLEPDSIFEQKIVQKKEAELWCFDPATGRIDRADQRFHDARYVDRGGYGQVAIYEEPSVPQPVDGSPRIVAQVVVTMTDSQSLCVRRTPGLNGEVVELQPSSLSKGELASGEKIAKRGLIESNPQRIQGVMEAVLVFENTSTAEKMSPEAFRAVSTDCRSLGALAALGF